MSTDGTGIHHEDWHPFFQIVADLTHAFGLFMLVAGLVKHRDASTVSIRSIEIYLIVLTMRYTDFFHTISSFYLSFVKGAGGRRERVGGGKYCLGDNS